MILPERLRFRPTIAVDEETSWTPKRLSSCSSAVGEGQVKISLHAAEKALWQRRLYGIRAAPAQGGYAVQAQDW